MIFYSPETVVLLGSWKTSIETMIPVPTIERIRIITVRVMRIFRIKKKIKKTKCMKKWRMETLGFLILLSCSCHPVGIPFIFILWEFDVFFLWFIGKGFLLPSKWQKKGVYKEFLVNLHQKVQKRYYSSILPEYISGINSSFGVIASSFSIISIIGIVSFGASITSFQSLVL